MNDRLNQMKMAFKNKEAHLDQELTNMSKSFGDKQHVFCNKNSIKRQTARDVITNAKKLTLNRTTSFEQQQQRL